MKTITSFLTAFMLLNSIFIFGQAGTLDSNFGNNGKATLYLTAFIPSKFDRSIAVQQDGKIIVAGSSPAGVASDMAVVRFKPNGLIDKSFGFNGKATVDFGGSSSGYAVVIQPDGKILVAGTANPGSSSGDDFALARFKTDGTLDSSFRGTGKVWTDISSKDEAHCIAIQTNGKILAGGSDGGRFTLVRYNTNGSLDNKFGTDGIVTTNATTPPDRFGTSHGNSIAIQSNGKILLGGNAFDSYPLNDFAMVRYNLNGKVDSSFGMDGQVHPLRSLEDEQCNSIAVLNNGGILMGGAATGPGFIYDFTLVKFKNNGTLDSNFGTNGILFTDIDSSSQDYGYSLLVQPDGKFILGGFFYRGSYSNGSNRNIALVRYKQNGRLDVTFGKGGKVITDFNHHGDSAFSLALQQDGKILLAGQSGNKFILVRYYGDNISGTTNNEQLITTDKIISAFKLSLYPNPSIGDINISYECSSEGQVQIKLFDVSGRIVFIKNDVAKKGINVYHLNLPALTPGIYYAELINNDERRRIKFVIGK